MDTPNNRVTGAFLMPEEQLGQQYTLVVPLSPPLALPTTPPLTSASPEQSGGHRTRKEKLICRSVTDSSVSTSVSTMLNQDSPSVKFKHSVGSNVSPPRKSLKRILPTTPRPYRKKHGAAPVKSIIDPLNREAYEMTVKEYKKREKANQLQQQPRIAKRPYKRRTPLTPPVSSSAASGEVPSAKTKSDRPIKDLGLGSNSRHLSTSTSNIQHEHGNKDSGISTTTTSSSLFNSGNRRDPYELLRHHLKDKKSPYLPVFGSPNVMPIFKPGQKPWLLLNSLMNGTEKNNSENQPINDDQKGKMASSGPTVDSNILKDKSSDRVDDTSRTCGRKEVEIVAVPVDCIDDDKLVFTAEDRFLFEYLLSIPEREQAILSNQRTITNSPAPYAANRLQAPSPSPSTVSSSSNNNGSLRRYSRRRHSSLHPAFEQEHCLYSNHTCTLPLAYGSTYCIKHVPERYSPYYVQCAFLSSQSGKRCRNLQYSEDGKKKFCDVHASRLALRRQKNCRKPRPSKTFKDDVSDIKRILEQTRRPQRSEAITYLEDLCDYKLQTQCMEYQMESKGPTDVDGTVESLGQFQGEYDSDGGVETGEQYECLKHAGFYTTEEVVRILQSKLQRLRQLYVKEFDFIKFYYLMKRREYLLAEDKLKNSNVIYTSDPNDLVHCHGATVEQYSQDILTVKKMNSLHNYKKLRGDRAVLHHIARKRYEELKEKEKTTKTSSSLAEDVDTESESDEEKSDVISDMLSARAMKTGCTKPKVHLCIFHEGQVKCRNVAMPAMKHCMTHILLDEKQCMFERCTYPIDDNETCPAVILKRIDKGRCDLHRRIFVKDLPDTIKEEEKERLKIKSVLPRATREEAQTMLEDLIAKEIRNVDDFDVIVQDIFAKGLDCSDTDHTYSGSDDDEEGQQGRKTIGRARTVNGR